MVVVMRTMKLRVPLRSADERLDATSIGMLPRVLEDAEERKVCLRRLDGWLGSAG